MPTRVSLTELHQAGVRLRPAEAAAVVAEVCRQWREGRLRGVPSANVIRLTQDGEVVTEGPVNAGGQEVPRAAHLLDDLLPGFDAPPEFRASGGLRLAIARALGTLDVPPFASLDEFCTAIQRFAAPDVRPVARELFESWMNAVGSALSEPATVVPASPVEPLPILDLTISDVRRARRATGLSLTEISVRCRIPRSLLRELEWGYLRNWPDGLYGRSQLVRYARAAGLDEQLVIAVAAPLIEEAAQGRAGGDVEVLPAAQPIEALVPVGPQPLEIAPRSVERPLPLHVAALPLPLDQRASTGRRVRRILVRAALATAALLAVVLAPTAWEYLQPTAPVANHDIVPRSQPAAPAPAADIVEHRAQLQSRPRQKVPDGVLPSATNREPSPVTTQPAAYSPIFSNTGTAVFFPEGAEAGSALMPADTDQRGTVLKITRIVDDNARNFHARPSPDGSRIAFDSDREGTRAVFVADSDGQHVRRVSGDGFAAVPSWSPDGRQLAFVKAEADNPRVWNLWTADLEGSDPRRITSYAYGQPWGGSWFPDGHRIAYSHQEQLVVLDLENGTRRVFTTPREGHLVHMPAVSPDGRRIIFHVYRDGAWLLDLRTGSMRRVLDDPSAEEYTWSPDGRRVAFHSQRAGGWGVWVLGQQ